MKKYIHILVIVIILAGVVVVSFSKGKDWVAYSSVDNDFSIEYPVKEIKPAPVDLAGLAAARIDDVKDEESLPSKMVLVDVTKIDSKDITSIDSWVQKNEKESLPETDPSEDTSFAFVNGEKAYIHKEGDSYCVLFFHNQKMYGINIQGLSQSDAEHVWNSFRFLK